MSSQALKTYVPGFHDEVSIGKMIYQDFGRTDLKVSTLGFGGSTLALCNSVDEEAEGMETVVTAIKSGINYIDTAPYYGEGKAEVVLGNALKKVPRQAYYIGTKVGRYTSDVSTMFDFSAERTLKSVEDSLKRLGLTYVDVIQVHDVEFAPNVDIIINETLPALQKIKERGLAKYIGITGYPVGTLKQIVELSKVKIDFVLSYCRCTLFDNILLEYVPYFENKRLGIINAAVLGMGLLTNNNCLPSWHPAKLAVREACSNAVKFCQENDVNIAMLALYYSLKQPGICTHLVGMATQTVLKENLDVLLNGLMQKEIELLREVQQRFFQPLQERNWENCELQKYREVINKKASKTE